MSRCGSSFDLDFSKQAGKGIGVQSRLRCYFQGFVQISGGSDVYGSHGTPILLFSCVVMESVVILRFEPTELGTRSKPLATTRDPWPKEWRTKRKCLGKYGRQLLTSSLTVRRKDWKTPVNALARFQENLVNYVYGALCQKPQRTSDTSLSNALRNP